MAGLPVQNVSVRVVCGNQELKVSGSFYTTEPPTRFKSTDNLDTTLETYVTMYAPAGKFQFSLTKGDLTGSPPIQWVVTPRKGPTNQLTDIKGDSKLTDTSYLNAILREFEEETGSTIPAQYFQSITPTTFCLNIAPEGKAVLDKNFNDIKPATETWEWTWQNSTGACGGPVVPAGDIQPTEVTKKVIAIKAKIPPPVPKPRPASTREEAIAYLESKLASATEKEKPKFTIMLESAKDSTKDRWKTVQIYAGKRKTIRRKKLGHSKRKGTSKRGLRR